MKHPLLFQRGGGGDALSSPLAEIAGGDQRAGGIFGLSTSKSILEPTKEKKLEVSRPLDSDPHIPTPADSAPPTERSGDAQKSSLAEKSGVNLKDFDEVSTSTEVTSAAWAVAGAEPYTEFPHRFVACLEQEELSLRELRFLIFLARETFGWHRVWVALKNKQIIERTRIPERHLRDTVKELQNRGIILTQERKGPNGQCLANNYSINENYFEKYRSLLATQGTEVRSLSDTSPAERSGDAFSAPLDETAGRIPAQSAGEDPCLNSGGRRIIITNEINMLSHDFPVLKKEDLNKDLKKSLSLSESEKYFNEIYFSKIRAPRMEREERTAFRDIIQRNKDLTLVELKECFSLVEADHDSKGNPIKSKFLWMAKGLDRILMEARDNLSWKSKPAIEETLSPIKSQSPTEEQKPDITPEEKQAREALLPELLTKRSNLIASEKAFLETSDDTDVKYRMTNCRNYFEEFLVANEALLAREVKKYSTTEPFRIKEWIAAIEKYTFTGSKNTANKQASIFKIILEQLGNWYEEAKQRNQPNIQETKRGT